MKSFDLLKSELTSYPVLRLYRPNLPTELHTNASTVILSTFSRNFQTKKIIKKKVLN